MKTAADKVLVASGIAFIGIVVFLAFKKDKSGTRSLLADIAIDVKNAEV